MEVEFDVKIDSGVLYDYMLHHTYTSFAGVVGTMVGALMLVASGMTGPYNPSYCRPGDTAVPAGQPVS